MAFGAVSTTARSCEFTSHHKGGDPGLVRRVLRLTQDAKIEVRGRPPRALIPERLGVC